MDPAYSHNPEMESDDGQMDINSTHVPLPFSLSVRTVRS